MDIHKSVNIDMDSKRLIISYDYDDEQEKYRTVAMDLEGADWDMVNNLLGDVNFWAQFLTSLSAALTNPGKILDDSKE